MAENENPLIDVLKVLPFLPKRDRTKGERWSVDDDVCAECGDEDE